MTQDDAAFARAHAARVITVNTTFRLMPRADAHYTNDHDWLAAHIAEMHKTCKGEFWTGHVGAARAHGAHLCPFDRELLDLSLTPGVIGWGGNSGFAAINLAHQFGARKIVLLGFDQKWTAGSGHWHGKHPAHLQNRTPGFHRWAGFFATLAKTAAANGVEIVNASRDTALTCFRCSSLESALCSN